MKASRIFETCLYAADVAAAERFYTRVLGLEVASRMETRGVAFRCGAGVLIVFDPKQTQVADGAATPPSEGIPPSTIPAHGASGAGHMAFVLEPGTMPAWRRHLSDCGVSIEAEVDWPSGGRSLYFRDPAGNLVELAPPTLWGFGTRSATGAPSAS